MSPNNQSLVLLHAEADALTVSWPEKLLLSSSDVRYVLQYRPATADDFVTLSENLTVTQVRKKNLTGTDGFVFRVKAVGNNNNDNTEENWCTHAEPFRLLTADEAAARMEAPTVVSGGSSFAAIISWKKKQDDTKYEIQMREAAGGVPWETIVASFASTQVKKKNLTSPHGYQFRVRPAGSSDAFSPPSNVFVGMGLSPGLQRLFGTLEKGTLLANGKASSTLTLEDALGGKEFILLYASAHWCGPCRQFTPMLKQWYQGLGPNKPVEVVFLSADHDESGFQSYYSGMPWLAVNFDEDTREELMSFIRVTGIPRLCVLDAKTGSIIEDNAVGKPFDINRWRSLR